MDVVLLWRKAEREFVAHPFPVRLFALRWLLFTGSQDGCLAVKEINLHFGKCVRMLRATIFAIFHPVAYFTISYCFADFF